jgi:hypothetical protein
MNMSYRSIRGALGVAVALAMGVAVSAPAAIIYQQTFSAGDGDLLTDYGFSQSGLTGTATVSGGQVGIGGDNVWKVWDVTQSGGYVYDWSNPLTLSVTVGSDNTGGVGNVAGIFIGTGTGTPGAGGLVMEYYWPSPTDVIGFVSDGNLNNRVTPFPSTTKLENGSNLYELALTIRQNAGDIAMFDIKWTVNGINQKTTNDGWAEGYSKSTYSIDGSPTFGTIGMRNDGVAGTQYYDNLTLSVIPEPASLGMLGAAAAAMLLRRRIRG